MQQTIKEHLKAIWPVTIRRYNAKSDRDNQALLATLQDEREKLKNDFEQSLKSVLSELKKTADEETQLIIKQLITSHQEQTQTLTQQFTTSQNPLLEKQNQAQSQNETNYKKLLELVQTLNKNLKDAAGTIVTLKDANTNLKKQNEELKKQVETFAAEQKKAFAETLAEVKNTQNETRTVKQQTARQLTDLIRETTRNRMELAGRIFEPRPNYMEGLNRAPRDKKIIVSLTSYSKRIQFIAPCVYSLLHQTMRPDLVVLWLAESDFPHRNADLPQDLVRLQEQGLSIEWCEDIGPHKKYYEAMKRWPNDIIITFDDDVIYPAQIVESLYQAHQKHPASVCTTRVRQIRADEQGKLLPYNNWTLFEGPGEKGPSPALLPTGIGGVLYPPHCMDEELFNKQEFTELCLRNDDLWLKLMQLKKGTPVFKIHWMYPWITYVEGSQENALWLNNMGTNQNDVCLEKMRKYFADRNPELAKAWGKAAAEQR